MRNFDSDGGMGHIDLSIFYTKDEVDQIISKCEQRIITESGAKFEEINLQCNNL